LFADFEEANENILSVLQALELDPEVGLTCDLCGCEFQYDPDWIDEQCAECNQGALQIVRDGEMIKLPESVKDAMKELPPVNNSITGISGHSNVNNYGWGAGSGFSSFEKCSHTGDTVVFDFGGKQLFAGNMSGLDEWSGAWELIIDLAGVVKIPEQNPFLRSTIPARFHKLASFLKQPDKLPSEVLRLHWDDGGVPPVKLQFWTELWNMLPARTAVCCIGGHGRTGTCLASFLIAIGDQSDEEAIKTVRTVHCKNAIETFAQEKYLHSLYVEKLEWDLQRKVAELNADEVEKERAFIETVKANAPEVSVKTYSSYVPDSGEQLTYQNRVDLEDIKRGAPASYTFIPRNSKIFDTDPPELKEALKSGHDLRYRGGDVWIKECTDKECNKPDCLVWDHQHWIQWKLSSTKALLPQ
jgi:hypothetical protein